MDPCRRYIVRAISRVAEFYRGNNAKETATAALKIRCRPAQPRFCRGRYCRRERSSRSLRTPARSFCYGLRAYGEHVKSSPTATQAAIRRADDILCLHDTVILYRLRRSRLPPLRTRARLLASFAARIRYRAPVAVFSGNVPVIHKCTC